jgi:hypothetical protein
MEESRMEKEPAFGTKPLAVEGFRLLLAGNVPYRKVP